MSPARLLNRSPANPWRALVALALSLVVVTIDNTVLNTALPTLARALDASTADLQWISDAYTLMFASLLILAGGLGMRFGLRRAMIAGLVIFGVGSAAAALSHSSGELIAFRTVMGLGAAFVMPATLASIIQLFTGQQRPIALSIWSAAAGLGVAIGPVVGGALLVHFSWGSVFWINVPLVVVTIVAQLTQVPNFPGRRIGRIDLAGAGLSIVGLAALVDAVIEGPSRGWLSITTLGEALGALAILAGFVVWELRTDQPMVDVRVFAHRVSATGSAALAVTFFTLFGALFALTQYLQLVHGFSPLKAGLGALPFAGAMIITSGLSSVVAKRLGTRATVALGLLVMAGGLGALGLIHPTTAFILVAGAVAIIGLGMGLVMAPASEATVAAVPLEQGAAASSINSVTRELGGVFGIAVVGSIVSDAYQHHLASTVAHLSSSVPAGSPAHAAIAGASKDITAAHVIAGHLPPSLGLPLVHAANASFTSALTLGVHVAALVALAGAVAAWTWLPPRTRSEVEPLERVLEPAV